MLIDYSEIKQLLLEFSAFKLTKVSIEKIDENKNIQRLYPFQNTAQALSTKYIVILVQNKKKIIDVIYLKLVGLEKTLEGLKKKYEKEEKNIFLLIYFFEKAGKCRDFRSKLQVEILKSKIYFVAKYWKALFAITTMVASFFLFFTYLGLSEYGIPINKLTNVTEVSFVLYILLVGITFLLAIFVSVVTFFLVPFIFFTLFSRLYFIIFSLIYIIVYLKIMSSCHKWSLIHKLNKIMSSVAFGYIFISLSIILFAFVPLQSILSTVLPSLISLKFQDKSGYQMIQFIYTNVYSGYPKLMRTSDGKQFYMVLDDNKYYYGYDVNATKHMFVNNHTDSIIKLKKLLCRDYDFKEEGYRKSVKNYLLYNPYIKPPYLNILLKKGDENITIFSFDEKHMLSKREFDRICKSIEDR